MTKTVTDRQQVTYRCEEKKEKFVATTSVKPNKNKLTLSTRFRCELCNMWLIADLSGTMSLKAHGRTDKTINHTLLRVKTMGVSE